MDPNETLRLAREAMQRGDNEMVAYYLRTLDEWITNGGLLPAAWDPFKIALARAFRNQQ